MQNYKNTHHKQKKSETRTGKWKASNNPGRQKKTEEKKSETHTSSPQNKSIWSIVCLIKPNWKRKCREPENPKQPKKPERATLYDPIRYDPLSWSLAWYFGSVRFGQWKSEIGGNPPDGPHYPHCHNLLQEFWNQNKNVKDQRTKRARHWILAGDYCTARSARIRWTKQTDKTGGACSL